MARFRSAAGRDLAPSDRRALALASELGRIGGQLRRLLGREAAIESLRRPKAVAHEPAPWKQGYRLGEAARKACPRPSGPIVDLESLLRDLGVGIAWIEFSDLDLEAASLWEPGTVPLILLNSSARHALRALPRRAAMAHELCHLLHDSGENDLTTHLSWHEEQHQHAAAVEQRARAFSPAFLAPKDEVRHWFRAGPGRNVRQPRSKVRRLAKHWGLSFFGAIWHAKNCRIIQSKTAEHLKVDPVSSERQEWANGFETNRTASSGSVLLNKTEIQVSPLARGSIAELTVAAAESGMISEGRAREILTWGRI